MMKLTTGLQNYANRRNLELEIDTIDSKELLLIWSKDNNNEWICSYQITNSGLFFHGNILLTQQDKEELPNWISDNKKLKEVLNFISINYRED